jgi:hypothetical protein
MSVVLDSASSVCSTRVCKREGATTGAGEQTPVYLVQYQRALEIGSALLAHTYVHDTHGRWQKASFGSIGSPNGLPIHHQPHSALIQFTARLVYQIDTILTKTTYLPTYLSN